MKERPILFSAPMVRAILAGKKTQTRRVLAPAAPSIEAVTAKSGIGFDIFTDQRSPGVFRVAGPVWAVRELMGREPEWKVRYGVPGDRLWVKETYSFITGNGTRIWYRADGEPTDSAGKVLCTISGEARWRSPLFMRRHESRITLEITEVRVQRLQDITEEDAIAEGITGPHNVGYPAFRVPEDSKPRYSSAVAAFESLWDSINGDRPGCAWSDDPWLWCISFKRVTP